MYSCEYKWSSVLNPGYMYDFMHASFTCFVSFLIILKYYIKIESHLRHTSIFDNKIFL